MAAVRRFRQDSAQRRAEIAEAALRVLGAQGLRGLTHRAVDAAAGLPPGSVNYHAPTRQRLLAMAAEEMFVQDMAVAARHLGASGAVTPADLAVGFVTEMSGPHARHRVIARHHLLGEARADPALRDHFDTARAAFVHAVRDRFAGAGYPAESTTAELWVIVIDGLVHRQVFFAESALSDSEIRAVVAALGTRPAGTGAAGSASPAG